MTTTTMSLSSILQGLHRLGDSLKNLDDKNSSPINHYQEIPVDIQQSYDCMLQGAQLVHATATKFTLVGKLSRQDATKVAEDLLKGCQLIATGALVIGNTAYGCARSTRQYTKRAARAVVSSVSQLVQALESAQEGDEILSKDNNLAAQKCGAVWQSCDVFLNKKMPLGNRNAMRRDLFTWMMECNETMTEFQQVIDRGPPARNENTAIENDGDAKKEEEVEDREPTFEEFLLQLASANNETEQYTEWELPMAQAAVALIKCSRGCINLVLKASEDCIGQSQNANALEWIRHAHDSARIVAMGMTDLGTLLYPTLDPMQIRHQGTQQAEAIVKLLDYCLNAQNDGKEWSAEVLELAHKIRPNVPKRLEELQAACHAAEAER